MSRGEVALILQGLFASDEQTAEWTAMARTSEARARIRRWSRVETVGIVTSLLGVALLIVAPLASVAVAVWSGVADADRSFLYWWIWGLTGGVAASGATTWVAATRRRQEACYADGRLAVGTVERAIEHPGSGDDRTWYDLRISAALPGGPILRRRLHIEGQGLDRRIGSPLRFRHNTLDPDDLDDLQFDGWPDGKRTRHRLGIAERGVMTADRSDAIDTFSRPWPGDPASAWAEARRAPGATGRLGDPPELDSADAASIADWIEDQKSLLPTFAAVCAAVGVVLIGGLLAGILPLSGAGGTSVAVHWTGGIGLLAVSAVLSAWEGLRRRRRRSEPPTEIPRVRMVLCELHPTAFNIHEGDGYRETCVAIDAESSDAQAARVLMAFGIWLDRLRSEPDAARRARDEAWQPPGASVFASEEIFGPDATGGYLVRRPNPPADGWGLLITPRRPAKLVGQLRFADVRQWTGAGWSL